MMPQALHNIRQQAEWGRLIRSIGGSDVTSYPPLMAQSANMLQVDLRQPTGPSCCTNWGFPSDECSLGNSSLACKIPRQDVA